VVDYGVMETPGMSASADAEAVETALLHSLEAWRIDIMAELTPEFVAIDSGDYTGAIYEFVRRHGMPFRAFKGWDHSRMTFTGEDSATRRHYIECRADLQKQERVWLYHFNSEYWKHQVQQRFLTRTFNETNQLNDGTLSVWSTADRKEHLSYSHHIVAEQLRETFEAGKGAVRKWVKVSKNNHWLDATAMALAASGVMGFRIVPRISLEAMTQPRPQPQYQPRQTQTPTSRAERYRSSGGGWMKRMKR
jgi:hypothetical protein